jgi:uncharacterized protein (DUF427 family)
MTLTLANGPLAAAAPDTVNYEVQGPAHRLLFSPFPRRARAVFSGRVLLDTRRGMLLHETGLMPVLYVPDADVDESLLEPTDHSTHCPFKGDASYWTVRVGERVSENTVWAYREPLDGARWLQGYRAVYADRMDAWFDEDEHVVGHLRDPYHRVDVRRSSRHVVVRAGELVVAESSRPMLLSETGLPNRYYLPPSDVRTDLLVSSTTTSICPYKGEASYWSLRLPDGRIVDDAMWGYHEPLDEARRVAGHLCAASTEDLTVEVDGERVP